MAFARRQGLLREALRCTFQNGRMGFFGCAQWHPCWRQPTRHLTFTSLLIFSNVFMLRLATVRLRGSPRSWTTIRQRRLAATCEGVQVATAQWRPPPP